jgi:hypothetical protein
MTAPRLRCARRCVLALGAITACSVFLPAAATAHGSARALSASAAERAALHEERALRREERVHEREQRSNQRRLAREERGGGGPTGCSLSIGLASERVVIGEAASVSGALTCPETEAAAGRTVTVYGAGHGAGHLALAITTTKPDGEYALTLTGLERNTMISVRAGRSRSARVAVKVAPLVTISEAAAAGQTASRRGGARHLPDARETFSGTVDARFAGRRVALQSSYDPADGQWRTVAIGRVGEAGDYSLTHSFRTPGQTWVRAVVHTPRGNVAGISEVLPYDAVATQNPDLTIESSTPLAAFGQTVVIHGLAAGPQQTVALLLLAPGGSSQTVAETSTGETGEYTFSLVGQRTGYYEARDATAGSIVLPVHVGFQITLGTPREAATAGRPVAIAGTIAPALPGEPIRLEQEYPSGAGFHPIATGTLEGSVFSLVHTFAAAGSYLLRVRALQGGGVESAASAPFTLLVGPAAG